MTMPRSELKSLIKAIIQEVISSLEQGEWWIYPGGQVQYAESQTGNGHQEFVISHLSYEILEHFGIEEDDPGYLAQYEEQLKQALIADGRLLEAEIEEWNTKSPSEIVLRKLI